MSELAGRPAPSGHPLDRPVWNALAGRQSGFALGDGAALRYRPDIGPLTGLRDDSAESRAALAALLPQEGVLAVLQAGPAAAPDGGIILKMAAGVQMVAQTLNPLPARPGVTPTPRIEMLGEADAPEMFTLARMTEPGPFEPRTHELGTFWGVKIDGRLAAMAGERMQCEGFTEVSGVCTHPDFRGRGLAAALSLHVADLILQRGETPFLHSYASNAAAISVYRTLGFVERIGVEVTMIGRS